ncbi:MAG: menaquinone biosynthesis protein [Bacteroidales bacterium]|nr:menaquinone biosynthesis protein [Bacteroidales bacterium]
MIRVVAIPYLNTAPFVYGLKQKALSPYIHLDFASPAAAAHQLHHDLCDLAIVPVAAAPSLPYYEIVGKYCIGAVSAVASVLLCSRVPVEQVREVALDQESRTSVLLGKLLLRDYWRVTPQYVPLLADLPESVVLIGDKALLHQGQYPYIYDLAEHWICWTGKPFVFAAWVANKVLPNGFAETFDEALAYGLSHIDEAIAAQADNRFSVAFAKAYLTQNISYPLDQEKIRGLELFWELIRSI